MNPGIPITFIHKDEEVYFNALSRVLNRDGNQKSRYSEIGGSISPLDLEHSSTLVGCPQNVTLLLSPYCNMSCAYCFLDQGQCIASRSLMPVHVAETSIDWIFKVAGPAKEPLDIVLFGGEPLLNSDGLRAAVTRARNLSDRHNHPVNLQVVTNLTLMTDSMARFLTENNVAIMVSIDGPPKVHNAYRTFKDGSGSYDSVIAGLSILKRYMAMGDIWARSTLTTGTSVLEVFQHLTELGFCKISLVPCVGSPNYEPSVKSYSDALDLVMEQYINTVRAGGLMEVHPLRMYLHKLYGFLGRNQRSHHMDCGAGLDLLAVAPDGDIYPCPSFAAVSESSRWVLGNVTRGTDRDRIVEFQERVGFGPEHCSSCWCHPLCDKGCKFERFNRGDPYRCVVKDTYQPILWQACLYWYAYLRDNDPTVLLQIVDPKASAQLETRVQKGIE